MLTIINGSKINSLSDKDKLFVMYFNSNSMLYEKGHPISESSPLIEHKLCNISIMSRDFSKFIKAFTQTKAVSPDKNAKKRGRH